VSGDDIEGVLMRRFIAALAAALVCAACAGTGGGAASVSPRTVAPDAALAKLPVKHVFVIVVENEAYSSLYAHNPNHYLGRKLQNQGTLLTHYYGIGHYSLDNYIAMISGQAPNPKTSADCGTRVAFTPSDPTLTIDSNGQAVGEGCVYPSQVKTIGDQLSGAGVSWGGYMDDMGATKGREQAKCGVPHLLAGGLDGTQRATAKDQYAARHNPFTYFDSLVNSGLCKQHVVNLTHLRSDLKKTSSTPRFSFITPDLCDDGHDGTCVGKNVAGTHKGGLYAIDKFLHKWVPVIKASPAFKKDGVLIITSDESEGGDATSCCNEQPGPTEPQPGLSGPGGGRTGTLVIGKCVAKGKTDATRYNHYSLLRSLEDIFGIKTGGTDGAGHLGFAAATGLQPFGHDLFKKC
jgi:hypothetical protein